MCKARKDFEKYRNEKKKTVTDAEEQKGRLRAVIWQRVTHRRHQDEKERA